jgi:hypothetical protein
MMLLIIGFTVIVGLLITIVANASAVIRTESQLFAAADGAAAAGANAVDGEALLRSPAESTLPLTEDGVRTTVDGYVDTTGLVRRFRDFRVLAVGTDGTTASVTFSARVKMPFINLLSAKYDGGYPVTVTSLATSPLRD